MIPKLSSAFVMVRALPHPTERLIGVFTMPALGQTRFLAARAERPQGDIVERWHFRLASPADWDSDHV